MTQPIDLANWRRQTAELYQEIRCLNEEDPRRGWLLFRKTRDWLFFNHSQTPLDDEQLSRFNGLPFFEYDPAARLIGHIDRDVSSERFVVELPADGKLTYSRAARVDFSWENEPLSLHLYWIEGYGGGLFLPFHDLTGSQATFGGGRYLFDTIKGADLGISGDKIVLDFNFAYNPSCAYNGRWVCPLPPRENYLPVAIEAGEKRFDR